MTKIETCYMCDEIATSKEHVPPKCIFPEKKDIGEDNFLRRYVCSSYSVFL